MEEAIQTNKVQYPNYVDTNDEKGIDCRNINVGPRKKYTLPRPEKQFDLVLYYSVFNETIIMLKPYFKPCGFQFLVPTQHTLKMCGYAKQAFTNTMVVQYAKNGFLPHTRRKSNHSMEGIRPGIKRISKNAKAF